MGSPEEIKKNVERLLVEIPEGVKLLAAVKTRSPEEVEAAYEAGIRYFGHNYVQEAQAMLPELDLDAEWHMIGHLQRNKAKEAVEMFDMIQSLDSIRLAHELEKRCATAGKKLEVLIEINSGAEDEKTGILSQEAVDLAEEIASLPHLHLSGLMTMGPMEGAAELSRPFFAKTRRIFEDIAQLDLPNVEMKILSMGMSGSFRVAIKEGATMVRLGTALFGPRS